MAERGVFLGPHPVPHQGWPPIGAERRPEDAPLTGQERDEIRDNFNAFISQQLGELDDTRLSPEEKARMAVFAYAYQRHRAQRYHDLGDNGFTRWVQQHIYSVGERRPEGAFKAGRAIERGVNWVREAGAAVVTGVAAKAGASMAVAPLLGHFLHITGGPAIWLTGAVAGGAAGAILGFRRGGERYVTKNLGAEKLREEFAVESLLDEWNTWIEGQHHEKSAGEHRADPLYGPQGEPESESGVFAGRELTGDYYDRVASTLAHLDQVAEAGMMRGNWQEKARLADNRAKLAAILETRAFFEEAAKRNEEEGPYFSGLEPESSNRSGGLDMSRLGDLWVELQESRTNGSLNERFHAGCSEKARQFVQDQRRQARAASWKGAAIGAVSGAILGGVMSHFFGGTHQQTTTPAHETGVPEGFGGGAVSGDQALTNALENKQFTSLVNLIEQQSDMVHNGNPMDPSQVELINSTLRSHLLPPIEHYTLPDGDNALLEIIEKAKAADMSDADINKIVYNFMSHYDHSAGGLTLSGWHTHLLKDVDIKDMADPDTFQAARDLYLDRLRLLGKIVEVPEAVTSTYEPLPATDWQTQDAWVGQGVIPAAAGYMAGEAVGHAAATHSFRVIDHAIPLTAEYAERFGKPLPAEGQMWEFRHGGVNYILNNLFRDVGGRVPDQPIYFKVTDVIGRYAYVTIINPPPDYHPLRNEFKIEVQEMLEEEAFQIHSTPEQQARMRAEEEQAQRRQRERESQIRQEEEQRQIKEWERQLVGQPLDTTLTYAVERHQIKNQPDRFSANVDQRQPLIEPTTGWPIVIDNPNEISISEQIVDRLNRIGQLQPGHQTVAATVTITAVDGHNRRIHAKVTRIN